METILFVDDSRISMLPLVDSLNAHGYEVIWAKNATEALRIAKEQAAHIDVILTDVMMPLGEGLSHSQGGRWAGIELIKQLKNSPETKDIPIVALTIVTDPEIQKELQAMNIVTNIPKGGPISRVLAALRQATLSRGVMERLRDSEPQDEG